MLVAAVDLFQCLAETGFHLSRSRQFEQGGFYHESGLGGLVGGGACWIWSHLGICALSVVDLEQFGLSGSQRLPVLKGKAKV